MDATQEKIWGARASSEAGASDDTKAFDEAKASVGGLRAEPSVGLRLELVSARIAAAAREAVAVHIDELVREQVVAEQEQVAVERTQAASLALLAARVRARARAGTIAGMGGLAS